MNARFADHRPSVPGPSPLRSAIWLAVGALVLGGAMLLGLIVAAVFLASLLIAGTVFWIRSIWSARRIDGARMGETGRGRVIEGEFRVVDRHDGSSRRPGDDGVA